ncbi:hypothetical protein D3C87_1621840 [compost metagenome]
MRRVLAGVLLKLLPNGRILVQVSDETVEVETSSRRPCLDRDREATFVQLLQHLEHALFVISLKLLLPMHFRNLQVRA